MDPQLVRELILDYNNNPDRYNDSEAEIIATAKNAMPNVIGNVFM